MNIKYKEITEYYVEVMKNISNIIYSTQNTYNKSSEEWNAIESSYLEWYGSKEKAYYRIIEILDMQEYYKDEDFQYWALEKFSEARHRIESYLENATGLLDFSDVEYKEYDDIVMKYYQPIRLSKDEDVQNMREESFDKYNSINHRKIMINLGLVRDVYEVKEAIISSKDLSSDKKREQLDIVIKILDLCEHLDGYDISEI